MEEEDCWELLVAALEEEDCWELLVAALEGLVLAAAPEAEDWADGEDEVVAEPAEVAVASEAEELAAVAVALDAVGIALSVDPVSCGRFPCAIAVERSKPEMRRKSIIGENADESREDRILAVARAVGGSTPMMA